MLTPGQVSESLDVPPSTLRRWAGRFADHLSPQPSGRGHRSYTVDDLNTFRRIRDLSGQGVLLDDIAKRLDVVDPPPDDTTDLITTEGYSRMLDYAVNTLQSMQSTITDQGQRITRLESRIIDAGQKDDQELKRLRKWAALPWYKRIFKPPTD
jgi:DNA-binding transcriptional MerR regulator